MSEVERRKEILGSTLQTVMERLNAGFSPSEIRASEQLANSFVRQCDGLNADVVAGAAWLLLTSNLDVCLTPPDEYKR
jgi:hypothetical protein